MNTFLQMVQNDYHRMIGSGDFKSDCRVELLLAAKLVEMIQKPNSLQQQQHEI